MITVAALEEYPPAWYALGGVIYNVPRVMQIAVHDTSTVSLDQRDAGVAGLGGARGLGHSSSILCGGMVGKTTYSNIAERWREGGREGGRKGEGEAREGGS